MYGKSKVIILYPVRMSGSIKRTNSLQAKSKSSSFLKEKTCVPTIGAHVLSVNTFLTNGSSLPLNLQTFAIYMIESWSATGNFPLSDKHSISKDRIRSGATLANFPSHFL